MTFSERKSHNYIVQFQQFIADASEVMDMLLKTHSEGDLPDDDPQTSYLISAWARICKILGKISNKDFMFLNISYIFYHIMFHDYAIF